MRNLLEKYSQPLRAPDGGGDLGGGGDGGGDGGWTPPAGLPDNFKGADANETLSKLLTGYTETNTRFEGLRDKLSKMPTAPEKPEDYTYQPSDKLKPFFAGDLNENPAFTKARAAFHKHGVPQQAFAGVIEDLYGPLVEEGLISPPYNPQAEIKTFGAEHGITSREELATALTNAKSFAEGLFGQLKDVPEKLQPDVKAALVQLTDTAAGNTLLRALSSRLSENGIRIGGESTTAGELTVEDLKKLDADPRIDPKNRNHTDPSKRFDEQLRKQYDEAYKKLAPAPSTAW